MYSSLFYTPGDSKTTNATVRWTVAATSSKTGGYLHFCHRQKCKQISSGSLFFKGFFSLFFRFVCNLLVTATKCDRILTHTQSAGVPFHLCCLDRSQLLTGIYRHIHQHIRKSPLHLPIQLCKGIGGFCFAFHVLEVAAQGIEDRRLPTGEGFFIYKIGGGGVIYRP